MDQDRTAVSLRDDLGREIERVLAVDPAPDLGARVRMRIERERSSPRWSAPGWLVGAVALAVVVAAASIIVPEREAGRPASSAPAVVRLPSDEPAVSVQRAPSRQQVVEAAAGRGADAVPAFIPPAASTEPAVLIAEGEAAALRMLMANLREGRIDPAVLAELQQDLTPVEPLAAIAIQPIAIEPLARLQPLEGERQ